MPGLPAFGLSSYIRRFALPLLGAFAIAVALAATLGLGTPAQAGLAMPALATAPAVQAVTPGIEPVRWVCGPWRCVWRPNYPGYWYQPPYARGWGPPVRPACYWHRGWGGGWVHTCP
ncbi:hypothetical protein [Ancylobacter defluvii]|uniref:Uncharacterized protein n=1 Tax=Ancylobacter defluvii TaxID=1282440 RepID=A0A9W6JVF5_9HYPH|nr:hypothetical protein [Ancylobacter defluvii]GLK84007.1 hypothetical protein GCM10017653_20770 [Ancylobacter defluvii]